jgi:hypothetical protein
MYVLNPEDVKLKPILPLGEIGILSTSLFSSLFFFNLVLRHGLA